MSNFHVGQVVVCINASGLYPSADMPNVPVGGCVYTIREIRVYDYGLGVTLAEVVNPFIDDWPADEPGEADFAIERFRPAKTTSIDVFTALLAPTSKETV